MELIAVLEGKATCLHFLSSFMVFMRSEPANCEAFGFGLSLILMISVFCVDLVTGSAFQYLIDIIL